MSIGSTIKRLRRERDITQEQLAEYLGITSRAVSQWECDRTAPDISQLPVLCHIFDVSSDVLLGIDTERSREIIQKYLDQAKEEEHRGNFEQSAETLREAHRQFPKSYPIMERLANMLVCLYSRKGIKDYDEVFDLCRRILAECTDSATRARATETLAFAYGYADKEEEMRKLAAEMPRAHFSYESFMLYRWQGDADLAESLEYVSYLTYQLVETLGCLAGHRHDDGQLIYSPEERIALRKQQVALLELLCPDGDYQYMAQYGEIAASHLAILLLRANDLENTWYWLEKAAEFAAHMDTYDFDTAHTSLALRGYCDGGWIMEAGGNRSQTMTDWLCGDGELAPLRADPRYSALLDRLRKTAKKP